MHPDEAKFVPYHAPHYTATELHKRSQTFRAYFNQRRSLRFFSEEWVPKEVIENIVMAAATAPSGANKQPWTFCAVSDAATKKVIREAAEKEEYESYTSRMSEQWLQDLIPFGTDWQKPFLEIAPWLVIVFKKAYDLDEQQNKHKNYYVNESVGIATGLLLAAIHHAGLVALTHTPSPMNFLQKILQRPENERPFLLIPVGYPAQDAVVPDIQRKPVESVLVYY
jgi:nitroreductase